MAFYQKFVEYCARAGKAPCAVLTEVGISKSNNSYWKHGSRKPTDAHMQALADYFGVDVRELSDGAEPENGQKNKPIAQGDELSEEMKELLRLYQRAPEAYQAAALALLRSVEAGFSASDAE